jgi:hypothetical protein
MLCLGLARAIAKLTPENKRCAESPPTPHSALPLAKRHKRTSSAPVLGSPFHPAPVASQIVSEPLRLDHVASSPLLLGPQSLSHNVVLGDVLHNTQQSKSANGNVSSPCSETTSDGNRSVAISLQASHRICNLESHPQPEALSIQRQPRMHLGDIAFPSGYHFCDIWAGMRNVAFLRFGPAGMTKKAAIATQWPAQVGGGVYSSYKNVYRRLLQGYPEIWAKYERSPDAYFEDYCEELRSLNCMSPSGFRLPWESLSTDLGAFPDAPEAEPASGTTPSPSLSTPKPSAAAEVEPSASVSPSLPMAKSRLELSEIFEAAPSQNDLESTLLLSSFPQSLSGNIASNTSWLLSANIPFFDISNGFSPDHPISSPPSDFEPHNPGFDYSPSLLQDVEDILSNWSTGGL